MAKKLNTFIKDIITRTNTKIKIQQSNDCIWITIGNEKEPRIFIDSVDGVVRVGSYRNNAEEPEIYPTEYKELPFV